MRSTSLMLLRSFATLPCLVASKARTGSIASMSTHAIARKATKIAKEKLLVQGVISPMVSQFKDSATVSKNLIKGWLTTMEDQLQSSIGQAAEGSKAGQTQLQKLHKDIMTNFYKKFESGSRVVSHWACLCCLMNSPEHALPCAHILCSDCAESFGTREYDATLTLASCPLHENDKTWRRAYRIRLKPDFAGVRILSLDGYVGR